MNSDMKREAAIALGLTVREASSEFGKHLERWNQTPREPIQWYRDKPAMPPVYENMTILARCIGHQRFINQVIVQRNSKRRLYEATLLKSLENMRIQAESANIEQIM